MVEHVYRAIGKAVTIKTRQEPTAKMLWKYDGEIQHVSKVRFIKKLHGYIFETVEAVTDKGIHYTFLEDWFV